MNGSRLSRATFDLTQVPLFRMCDDECKEAICSSLKRMHRGPGAVITAQGEAAKCIYIVRAGHVSVSNTLLSVSTILCFRRMQDSLPIADTILLQLDNRSRFA